MMLGDRACAHILSHTSLRQATLVRIALPTRLLKGLIRTANTCLNLRYPAEPKNSISFQLCQTIACEHHDIKKVEALVLGIR